MHRLSVAPPPPDLVGRSDRGVDESATLGELVTLNLARVIDGQRRSQ